MIRLPSHHVNQRSKRTLPGGYVVPRHRAQVAVGCRLRRRDRRRHQQFEALTSLI